MRKFVVNEEFREGSRCPRLFWLDRESGTECHMVNKELSEAAQNYIKGGKTVRSASPEEMASQTAYMLSRGKVTVKGPVFITGDICLRAEILTVNKEGCATVYFTQSALHVRRVFCKEAALLLYAVEELGFENVKVILLLPDKRYTREGDIDARKFFACYDLTADARAMKDKAYGAARSLCRVAEEDEEPKQDIHQGCFNPDTCKYFGHCTGHLPNPNVFKISRLPQNTKLKLYNEGKYSYESLAGHPALTDLQKKQINMTLRKAPPMVNKKELGEFLGELWYPMCFLDFESWQPPVPPADGMKAFEQIPFQYSLHVIEKENGEMTHKEFLARGEADPREELAENLVSHVPDGACVVVYNKQFEKMVIGDLASSFPRMADKLRQISENIRDLMVPFQKRLYYDRRMEGSFSIKAVLPALYPDDPELCYNNLCGVHNGSQAMLTYSKMSDMSEEEREKCRTQLLKYCELDTLAMVKILEKLRTAI